MGGVLVVLGMKLFLFFTAAAVNLCVIFQASATTRDEVSYFKLHQATGLFEQFLGKHCPKGKDKAAELLAAFEDLPPAFVKQVGELKKLMGRSPSPAEMESFRLSLHQSAEALKLHHSDSWHQDVVKECRNP